MIGLSNELAIAGRDLNISVNTLAPGAGTRLTATVMPPEQVEVMKPDFVAPLVGYLTHPDVFMTAGIYESSVGWNAAVRVQRSGGAVFAVPFTAEQVKERWDEVNNFDDGRVEYPTSMGDVRNAMLRAAYYNKGLKDSSKAKL